MNYIKKLERDKRIAKYQMDEMKIRIEELRAYIHSDKFNCGDELDGYVSVKDIEARIQHILTAPQDIESDLGFKE